METHKIKIEKNLYYQGSYVQVLESFGKLWKLISVFSRTLKVLENQVFCHGLWKVMEIYHVLAEMLR